MIHTHTQDYPDLVAESRVAPTNSQSPRKVLVVMVLTEAQKQERAEAKKKEKLRALDEAAGFLRILR